MSEDKIQDFFDDLKLDLITSKDFDSKAMITAIKKEQVILIMNIINENRKLKQTLNEIKDYIKNTTTMIIVGKPMKLSEETSGKDILQIIEKVEDGNG